MYSILPGYSSNISVPLKCELDLIVIQGNKVVSFWTLEKLDFS